MRLRRGSIGLDCSIVIAFNLLLACGSTGSAPAPAVVRVEVQPGGATVQVGQTAQFSARAVDRNGGTVANPPALTWSATPADVASVDQTGRATALKAGAATITATIASLNLSGTAALTVSGGAQSFTLTVNRTQGGGGHVTSSPAGLDCDFGAAGASPCVATFNAGTAVTLTALAHADSTFLGWAGACSGTGLCQLTLSQNTSVEVQFQPSPMTQVQVNLQGNGSGTVTSAPAGISCRPTCTNGFAQGQTITLTAAPDNGSVFGGWSGACGGSGTCTFNVGPSPAVINATFNQAQAATHTLSVNVNGPGEVVSTPAGIDCGNGHSSCSATLAAGTSVSLAQTAGALATFAGWGGGCSGTGACSVTLSQDSAVSAAFNGPGTVSVTVTGSGTVTSTPAGISCSSGTCSAQFAAGTSVALSAAAGASAFFSGWSGACNGAAGCTVTATAGATTSVTAAFGALYGLSVTVSGAGSVASTAPAGFSCASGTCTQAYQAGTSVTLHAAAASAASSFAGWSGDCAGTADCTVQMSAARAVTATFVPTYTLTVTSSSLGTVNSDSAIQACGAPGGTCTATVPAGTVIHLTPVASGSAFFVGWAQDCAGATCAVAMNANHAVTAQFADFTVSVDTALQAFSLVAGETRSLPFAVTLVPGSTQIPIAMTLSALPGNLTATFTPQTATATPGAPLAGTLSIAAPANAPLGITGMTVTATSGTAARTALFNLEVRSPNLLASPRGVAIESGNATALVVEGGGPNAANRVSRVAIASKAATRTVASLPVRTSFPRSIAIEPSGNTALVPYDNTLARVDLQTGAVTAVTTALFQPLAVALEPSGTSALVTDCNTQNDCNNKGRVVRVDLSTGAVTQVSAALTAFNFPSGIAVEPDDAHALVAEYIGGRVSRLNLATGGVTVLNGSLPGSPLAVLVEDGAHALVAIDSAAGAIVRLQIPYGMVSWVAAAGGHPGGFAQPPPGGSALATQVVVTGVIDGFLRRVQTPNLVETLAPAASGPNSLTSIDVANGFAVEASGTTALLADGCSSNGCGTGVTGRIDRVDLTTGAVTVLNNAVGNPRGLTLEAGGASALVAVGNQNQTGNGAIVRYTLANGGLATLTQSAGSNPIDVIAKDASTLVESNTGNGGYLANISLPGGAATNLATFACCSVPWQMQLESSGGSFLFAFDGAGAFGALVSGALDRYSFSSGAVTTLVPGFANPTAMAIESGGGTAIVAEGNAAPSAGLNGGRILRANLASGQYSVISTALFSGNNGNAAPPQFLRLEGSGNTALVTTGQLGTVVRASLTAPVSYQRLAGPFDAPAGIAVEASGTTALLVVCGANTPYGSDPCATGGGLVRVDLTGANPPATVVGGLDLPKGLALESATSALVTDCGPTSSFNCSANGRILRVNLTTAAVSALATGLNDPRCITLEAAGTALVCEAGTGRILRVASDGSYSAVGANFQTPLQVTIETEGKSVLVGTAAGQLQRLDLTTAAVTNVASFNLYNSPVRFALRGGSAVVAQGGAGLSGGVAVVNLATGGTDLSFPTLLDSAAAIVPVSGGWLISEGRRTTGGLYRLATFP